MRAAVPVALFLCIATATHALEFAYYTSVRNDSGIAIEITPDVINSRSNYTVQPRQAVTFLGGFSTEGFVVRTGKQTFNFKFPLTFGTEPTHYKGCQRHSYVFTREHTIYPLDRVGAVVHDAPGFPLVPH